MFFYARHASTLAESAGKTSNLNHFEVFLAGTTFWTRPVHGHISPGGAGSDTVFYVTQSFVVDPSTNQAHPGSGLSLSHGLMPDHYN